MEGPIAGDPVRRKAEYSYTNSHSQESKVFGLGQQSRSSSNSGKGSAGSSRGNSSKGSAGSSRGNSGRGSAGSSRGNSGKDSAGSRGKVAPIEATDEAPHKEKPRQKNSVRFSEIQIRDYERVVGDNPSCSSGPPIGIGWCYGDARVMDLNSYEEARPYRRKQASLVLNRQRREELLNYWEIPIHDIVEAIRGNIRVKNQRRQTVTNLGKVEKIEEAFESATKKLKKVLLLKRRSEEEKFKEYPMHPQISGPNSFGALKLHQGHYLRDYSPGDVQIEQEAEQVDLAMQAPGSTFWRIADTDPDRRAPAQIVVEDDIVSTMSGFTLENSTTASAMEMEQFYRELELEMFGDSELPSMVGQTLELPDELADVDGPSDHPGRNGPVPLRLRNIQDLPIKEYHYIQHAPVHHTGPVHYDNGVRNQPSMPHYVQNPPPQNYMPFYRGSPILNQTNDTNLSRATESLDLGGSSQLRGLPSQIPPYMATVGPTNHQTIPQMDIPQRQDPLDGPEVRHVPLQAHISPSQWMDGSDVSDDQRVDEPVTISEDQYVEDDQLFLLGGQSTHVEEGYSQQFSPNNGQFPPNNHYHR